MSIDNDELNSRSNWKEVTYFSELIISISLIRNAMCKICIRRSCRSEWINVDTVSSCADWLHNTPFSDSKSCLAVAVIVVISLDYFSVAFCMSSIASVHLRFITALFTLSDAVAHW